MRFLHPKRLWNRILSFPQYCFYHFIPDSLFHRIEYRKETGKILNLKNPSNIDEKLQWIKIHDRKDIYHKMIDKIAAKQFVASLIGEQYIVPLLGAWSRFEDIDFNILPNAFVLKCNHDSGSYVIVPDKNQIDLENAKFRLNNALKNDYYHTLHKQWGYKDITPMILAEPLLPDNRLEIQVFCNNGAPVFFLVRSDLGGNELSGFAVCYSIDWRKRNYRIDQFPDVDVPRPRNYDKIIQFSRLLSKDTLHLRVDFYELENGDLFIGELTFYSHGGYFCNFNDEGRRVLSDTLMLPV